MSKRPTAVILTLGTVGAILKVINANVRVPCGRDTLAIEDMRDALIADGVIKCDDYGDYTFSDFYAERDDNE